MRKKLILLAAGALAALAFAALPSAAMGAMEEWECETSTGAVCGTFSGTNNSTTVLTEDGSALTVECTSNDVHGEYATKKTAQNVTILFHGCKSNFFGGSCQSAGMPAGTIETFVLSAHNAMLEKTGASGFPNGTPGILLTPNASGDFATFECNSGFATVHVRGNGIMGDVTKECGKETAANTNITLDFATTAAGTQRWTKYETEGTAYDLSTLNTELFGNVTRTGGEDGSGSIHFANATKVTCP
jgi:hypothetical protein